MKLTPEQKLIEAAKLDGWAFTKKDDEVYRNKFKFGASKNGRLLTFKQCHTIDNRDEYMGRLEEFYTTEWDFDSLESVLRELPKYNSSYGAIIQLIQKQPEVVHAKMSNMSWLAKPMILNSPSQLLDALLAAHGHEV